MGRQGHGHLREWAELVGDRVPESALEESEDREGDRSRRSRSS